MAFDAVNIKGYDYEWDCLRVMIPPAAMRDVEMLRLWRMIVVVDEVMFVNFLSLSVDYEKV